MNALNYTTFVREFSINHIKLSWKVGKFGCEGWNQGPPEYKMGPEPLRHQSWTTPAYYGRHGLWLKLETYQRNIVAQKRR